MDSSFLLLSLLGILSLLIIYVKKQQSFWSDRGIRSPPYLFGIGHSLERFFSKDAFVDVFDRYYRNIKDDIVGLYFFTRPVALVRNMDLVTRVMISDSDHFISRGTYFNEEKDPISAHLFNQSGPKWRKLRTKLTPTFTSGKMKMMFPIIVDISNTFAVVFGEEVERHPSGFEIKQLTSRFTTDVIGNCAFGIECNSLKEPENNAYRLVNEKIFTISTLRKILIHFGQNYPKLARTLGIRSNSQEVNDFYANMVQSTLESRRKNPVARNDFMNILLKMHDNPATEAERVTFNEIVAQSFVFFLAGFETSSSTMMFALHELANNPEIQEKTVKHIKEVLARHNNEFTYEAMQEMNYLEHVVNETLRKYPPLPTLVRQVTKEYKVPDTDLVFPEGMLAMVSVHSIQMDPEYFPDPEKFDPTRFEAHRVSERPACTFMSFGEGPRVCIGQRFGMMQSKVGLVSLLTKFKFSYKNGEVKEIVFDRNRSILAPEGGIHLKVEKRDLSV